MRTLNPSELELISGGAPATPKDTGIVRAEPNSDVNGDRPGHATGWCRGFGNLKPNAPSKHGITDCGCAGSVELS